MPSLMISCLLGPRSRAQPHCLSRAGLRSWITGTWQLSCRLCTKDQKPEPRRPIPAIRALTARGIQVMLYTSLWVKCKDCYGRLWFCLQFKNNKSLILCVCVCLSGDSLLHGQELNSGHQAWQQVSLPTEPSSGSLFSEIGSLAQVTLELTILSHSLEWWD